MNERVALPDGILMAKKKTDVPKGIGRPKSVEGTKDERFGFRARADWMDWLQRFADSRRKDRAQLLDEALEELAKLRGFEAPPKR